MEERILTLHPDGKQGVNISRAKYDQIRKAILDAIAAAGELPFKELPKAVEMNLDAPFDGSLSWYVTTVKLDLEARDLIERIPGSRPQRLRLVQ
jgi:hypothetical protein